MGNRLAMRRAAAAAHGRIAARNGGSLVEGADPDAAQHGAGWIDFAKSLHGGPAAGGVSIDVDGQELDCSVAKSLPPGQGAR